MNLTPTSYIVLGMLELLGESTPYRIKQVVAGSVGHFWTFPHAQLYSEPERLAAAGLIAEEREQGGRRRKHYSLTEAGRAALGAWRAEPTDDLGELRQPALLKLFFGADPALIAPIQIEAHRRKLAEYEAIRDTLPVQTPDGAQHALEAGIQAESGFVAYWEELAAASSRAQ